MKASQSVEIQIGRERRNGTASVIEPSNPSYQRRWQIVNANNHDRYTGYQQKTTRPIPTSPT